MNNNAFIILDIETSIQAKAALASDKPPVIAISALTVDFEFNIIDTFNEKIKFRQSEKQILTLINYSDKKWKDAKPPLLVAQSFLKFIEKYKWFEKKSQIGNSYFVAVPIGHNLKQFDLPVLFNWYKALSKTFNQNLFLPLSFIPSIDTLAMAELWSFKSAEYPPSYKLPQLCKFYNLAVKQHHNSMDDCLMTLELFKKFSLLLERGE